MKTKPIDFSEHHFRRFWRLVDKSAGLTGCWNYTGFIDRFGYGRFTLGSSNAFVSNRVAYAYTYGDPTGKEVCHLCHNPACCNPNHLYAGSHIENMLDKTDRRRELGKDVYYGVRQLVRKRAARFVALAWVNGCQKRLGTFKSAIEAAKAWDAAMVEAYPGFSRLNFPQGT